MAELHQTSFNPNHHLGCHPLNLHEKLGGWQPTPISDNAIPYSRFTQASFIDGTIQWKRERSFRRKTLDRSLEKISSLTLPGADHVQEYLRRQYRQNARPATIRSACTALMLFLLFVKEKGVTHVEMITRRCIEAFVENEQDRNLKLSSVKGRLQTIYAFLRFLVKEEIVHPDLVLRRITIKLPQSLPRALTPEDTVKLLSVIDHVRDRAMILLLLRTGMRIGELLDTRINDLDLNEKTIKIYEAAKNKIGRVVYFSDDAKEDVVVWLNSRDHRKSNLFYGQGGGRWSYSAARVRFIKYVRKADLDGKNYTVHCLRHTYATDLLNAGMRLEVLQQLLGHSSLNVTRIYARLTDKTREEEYFKAMAKIERDQSDGHDQLDR
ncbi:MAG: tyrosine-type recombinase/integrase [FCB group bacterium]|nr:tyrosine-type recombinase/integrase [FCB group bacterium]